MNARPDPHESRPDERLSELLSQRRRLLNIAYRFLGSLSDAEDAVQETFARWYALTADQQDAIESLPAWLSTVISRLCLDQLGSARTRRESYVGQWLPEPVPDPADTAGRQGAGSTDPADRITLDESIDMAFLVVFSIPPRPSSPTAAAAPRRHHTPSREGTRSPGIWSHWPSGSARSICTNVP
jgi:DNA-directed RNA polymerase specialized sigma24 family protein